MNFAEALVIRALGLSRDQQEQSIRQEVDALRSRYRSFYGSRPTVLKESLAYAEEVEALALDLLAKKRGVSPVPVRRSTTPSS